MPDLSTNVPLRIASISQVALGNGAGAAAALTTLKAHVIQLRAICPGATVYIGLTTDIATVSTTVKTYPLSDGEAIQVNIANLNLLCAFGSAAGCYLAVMAGSYV